MLSMSDRFEINAAIERLVSDGPTFDPQDAEMLIRMVPMARHSFTIRFRSVNEKPGNGVEGFATGHGNVQIGDERPRVKQGGFEPEGVRVGGYKLIHRPGRIFIELMWADTKLELDGTQSDGQQALLLYNRFTKRPQQMRTLKQLPFEFVLWPKPRQSLTFIFAHFVKWKSPSWPGPSGQIHLSKQDGLRDMPRNRTDSADFRDAAHAPA